MGWLVSFAESAKLSAQLPFAMDLRQIPLRMDERVPSELAIKDSPPVSTARESIEEVRKRQLFYDAFGIKRKPTLSGAGDSEPYDANAKDIKPVINPKSTFSKAVPKELADLLSDLDTLDILGRRDGTEQIDDHGKASSKTPENSP